MREREGGEVQVRGRNKRASESERGVIEKEEEKAGKMNRNSRKAK